MRQKNVSGSTLQVMFDPPIEVGPGEELDHDELLAGFTPVDNDPDTGASSDGDRADSEPDAEPIPSDHPAATEPELVTPERPPIIEPEPVVPERTRITEAPSTDAGTDVSIDSREV